MTVGELIKKLQQCNPDVQVSLFDIDSGRLLKIKSIDGINNTKYIYINIQNS